MTTEGYCIKCARELGIKPIDDYIRQLGMTDEDIEQLEDQAQELLNQNSDNIDNDNDDTVGEENETNTPAFDFKKFLTGKAGIVPIGEAMQPRNSDNQSQAPDTAEKPKENTQQSSSDKQTTQKRDRRMLNAYCIDLTQKARDGKLDRIIGREKELDRVIQILSRRTKNNPCLIGEPGVGKTAVAEALAQKIVEGSVPYRLRCKEVFILDLTALVAGTQFRGQFETRVKGLVDEVKRAGNIILMIDEIHTLVSAGNAEGGMNAANILKPALSRGEIQVIGATTLDEYRKYIEKDQALERRFQSVIVKEPTIEQTLEILRGIKKYYETYHGVKVPEDILRRAVELSERYITDRYLPDKAIDLLDEACSKLAVSNPVINRIDELKDEISACIKSRSEAEARTNPDNATYELIATLKTKELRLTDEFSRLSKERDSIVLTENNLAEVIEAWTSIPAANITEHEFEKIVHLSETLYKRIIGQDKAIDAVCRAIKRARSGVSYKRKPVSFIFAGPTGVGKTELVKCLADALFDSVESLIRLDMSEFMEKHAISRIIGSPPGYVGYDEAGQLTEKIRRKPYSVVLFDEIEKAHPDVMNILLQILDDGRISDAHGKEVNFENTVIVMTTNAGTNIKANVSGFTRSAASDDEEKTKKGLNEFLRPEFINRVDEIITFNRLTKENFREIARLRISELEKALGEKGITLDINEELYSYIADHSFSELYGARNLKRFIQTDIEDKIAEAIISSYGHKITRVAVTIQDSAISVTAI